MFDALWEFVKHPTNRDALGWIGAGIVAVAGGLWAFIKFYSGKDEGSSKPSVSAKGGSAAIGGANINSPINIGARGSDERKR